MNILIISDGVPGHENQSIGLVELLQRQNGKIKYELVRFKLKMKWMRYLLAMALNQHAKIAALFIKLIYRFQTGIDFTHYDLIISTGGNTSFFNAYCGSTKLLKNIFIGSLRNLQPHLFSAILTLEDLGVKNNVVMPLSPTRVTQAKVKESAKKYLESHAGAKNDLWLMILGGNGGGCIYTQMDWINLANGMTALAQKYQIQWLITTSRRTELSNEKILQKLIPQDIIFEAVWYNQKPEKVMLPFLGLASKVFCTIDSMSMVTESISSGNHTLVMSPESYQPTDRFEQAIMRFEAAGFIQTDTLKNLSKIQFSTSSLSSSSKPSNFDQALKNLADTVMRLI
ncbi:MAG: hypothetical protein COW84_10520 [Gammaproteobacteria bacterium CG22_combo_CG10-13_8_21_14_all_40_8]|nr:MAG: hypothetical protein COW84_10520 [Gammaproteobacteria bacterium CG22_combo_CG10-13_8_21_14_all_40_8]